MTVDWQRVLPVIASIFIIVGVAVARQYSRVLAPILATMPINIPLTLWIVYAAERGDPASTEQFIGDVLINLIPTLGFLLVAWLAARAGWSLVAMIGAGYLMWAVGLGAIFVVRRMLGA
jgi:drug/metabolite transporter (DMT)-like permease